MDTCTLTPLCPAPPVTCATAPAGRQAQRGRHRPLPRAAVLPHGAGAPIYPYLGPMRSLSNPSHPPLPRAAVLPHGAGRREGVQQRRRRVHHRPPRAAVAGAHAGQPQVLPPPGTARHGTARPAAFLSLFVSLSCWGVLSAAVGLTESHPCVTCNCLPIISPFSARVLGRRQRGQLPQGRSSNRTALGRRAPPGDVPLLPLSLHTPLSLCLCRSPGISYRTTRGTRSSGNASTPSPRAR